MVMEQSSNISIGRNIEKIRKMRGIKQETLAKELGVTHQTISKLEKSDIVDEEKLELIAKALGVTVEGIKNFNEDATINYIQNNYEGSIKDANNFFATTNNDCTFNLFEKYVETIEKNEKLYQQLLQSEREKIEMLQAMLQVKS